jgi:hypothetical protein
VSELIKKGPERGLFCCGKVAVDFEVERNWTYVVEIYRKSYFVGYWLLDDCFAFMSNYSIQQCKKIWKIM